MDAHLEAWFDPTQIRTQVYRFRDNWLKNTHSR